MSTGSLWHVFVHRIQAVGRGGANSRAQGAALGVHPAWVRLALLFSVFLSGKAPWSDGAHPVT